MAPCGQRQFRKEWDSCELLSANTAAGGWGIDQQMKEMEEGKPRASGPPATCSSQALFL